jgi:natural product biosynthesis luciferase-like monooxygenase protein
MKFGVLHFFEHPAGEKSEHRVFREQLDTLRAAEDLGFDSVWAPEHHFTQYGFCASPMLTLAAMASVTRRVRLGTGVVVLPFNDPVRIAEEGAMIDLMSDGRLELGVGRGFQPVEFKGFGIDQATSGEIFEEALQIIERAWTADTVSFKGKHFNVQEHAVRPRPLQKPHPPIWMAAVGRPSFEMAGRHGYNLLCSLVPGFDGQTGTGLLDVYRTARHAAGHDPEAQVGALCMVYCAETTAKARQDFGGPVLWYYRTIADYVAHPAGRAAVQSYEGYDATRRFARGVEWDQLLESGALICGNPDVCIKQIKELQRKHGFNHLLCWTRLAGLSHSNVLESMQLFNRYVMPHFRREEPDHRRAAGA